jgi:arylsulfatase A-like enzyme
MERRKFLSSIAKATVASAFFGVGQCVSCSDAKRPSASAEQPNIILLIADNLGWKDLGCYGNEQVYTPNIDALAHGGIRFANAFIAAPSCSPSRASIITGQHPHTHGVTGLTHIRKRLMLSPFKRTLPEALAECGWHTAIEGKWHVAPYFPTSWYGYRERLSGVFAKDFLISSSDNALRFLEDNRDNAFYLELNYMNTHRGSSGEFYRPMSEFVSLESVDVPEYYALPDWPEIRDEVGMYYANVSAMDYLIGEVLAKVEQLGLAEKTLVCFVSDNGAQFPGGIMTLYDRGIGTPLIMRRPGRIPAGAINDNLVSTVDIMPTALDAAGCPISSGVQGRSVLPLATGTGDEPVHEAVFAEMTYHVDYLPMRAARTSRFKYIRNYSDDAIGLDQLAHKEWAHRLCELPNHGWLRPRVPEELYDLAADPTEQTNLAGMPEWSGELEKMRKILDRHMRETADPYLGKEFERNYSAEDSAAQSPGRYY